MVSFYRVFCCVGLFAFGVLLLQGQTLGQITSTWTGGAYGTWNSAANWNNGSVPGQPHNGVADFGGGFQSVAVPFQLNSFTRIQKISGGVLELNLGGLTMGTVPHYTMSGLPITAFIGGESGGAHANITVTNGTWNNAGRIQFLSTTASSFNQGASLTIGRNANVSAESIYAPISQHLTTQGLPFVSILSQGTLTVSGFSQQVQYRLNGGVLSFNSSNPFQGYSGPQPFTGSQSGVVMTWGTGGLQFTATATADDLASFSVAAGRSATVHSTGVANLGQTTNLTGGTILASNGVAIGQGRSLVGYGAVSGPVIGQAGSSITATGVLDLGSNVIGGFRTDGALNVQSHKVRLHSQNQALIGGVASLSGGTLESGTNGSIALGSGGAISGHGLVNAKFEGAAGSYIVATGGNLTIGREVTGGFFHLGQLATSNNTVTVLNSTRSTLGNQTTLGVNDMAGTLIVSNGAFLEFGRTITGFGTIDSQNVASKAMIINGDVIGNSASQQLTFNGYVKGIGTFENVVMNGTFAPGLSPAISHVDNLTLGNNAVLEMEIGGLTPGSQYDKLIDSGLLALNGTLKLILIDGYNPTAGATFDLIDWNSSIGSFANIDFSLAGLDTGLAWDTSALYTTGLVSVTAVPEPSAILLVGSVMAMTVARRRRT